MGSAGLRFASGLPSWLVIALACALLALVVLAFREHATLASVRRRRVLDALRIASVLAALALMLQPQWSRERVEEVQGRLAVLLDASRSMSVRKGDKTRTAEVSETLSRAFDRAKQKPSLYTFSDELAPATRAALSDETLASGDDTRIAHALASLVADDRELGAVLLVTDGADKNAAGLPAALARLGVRVHTLATGSDAELDDASIVTLQADSVAFLREPAQVQVHVRAASSQKGPLPITLRQGSIVLSETDVEIGADGSGVANLSFTPTRLGRAAYTVSIPTASDDPVPQNNQRAFLVRVVREKLRVLLVCGEPSWDARFLRALLKGNPAIDLITFFILRTQNDNSMAPPGELSLIPFPTDELFEQHLGSFDLVIFQDFDFGPYQMGRYLPHIRDYVMNGGSFAMLGGARSFGAGGYQGTPIADVLPVDIVSGEHTVDLAQFAPQLVAEATHHPLVELAPRLSDNIAAWAGLSPLVGVNLVAGAREGAQVLLQHPKITGQNGEPMPVLVAGNAGRGRSVALLSDSSFRWGITTGGRTGDTSAYERFWDRTLRWLGRDPLLDPAQVSTDRERYGPGAKLRVTAYLRDTRYRVLAQHGFRVVLRSDDGQLLRELPITSDAEGHATVELAAPTVAGAYTIAVRDEGSSDALAEESFVVEAGGDELADPRAHPELLRKIAEATGGHSFDAGAELSFDDLPSTRSHTLGTDVYAPFATPWFFACFVALICSEWWLRRRFGLR